MSEKMKKAAGAGPKPVAWTVIVLVMLLLLLVPVLRLAGYSVPWYDDYNYGRFAKTAMRSGVTLGNLIKGATECVHISWYAWQGTYGSVFLMVLTPMIWGEEFYFWGPVCLILLLTVSVCVFMYTFLRTVLKTEKVVSLGVGTVTTILTLELLHTPQAGIYWYNGGVHYVGMHSIMFLMLSVALWILYTEKLSAQFVLTPMGVALAVLTAGGNFVTTLQGLLFSATVAALWFLRRKKRSVGVIIMFICYAAGFFVNVLAPGNDQRAESYAGWGMSPVKAILRSFQEGVFHMWRFTKPMTLVLILFAFPMILHAVKKSSFRFKLPALVSIWSFCLYSSGFTPSLFSLGNPGLGRTLNSVKLTWQVLLVLNVIYWCGFICKKMEKAGAENGSEAETPEKNRNAEKQNSGERIGRWWYYPIFAVCVLICFHTEKNPEGSFFSYGAWYEVHSGLAYNFYQEYLERVEILKSDEQNIVFTPYHWTPWMICMGELSDDPKDVENLALSDWYDKESVRTVSED